MFFNRSCQFLVRGLTALIFARLLFAPGVAWPVNAAQAIPLAVWDFEGETRLPVVDVTNSAVATHGKGLGNESFPAGYNGSADAWSFNNWSGNVQRDDDYVEFTLDLSEYGHISFSFAERRSASGIHEFTIAYSVDGRNFTPIPATTTVVPDNTNWRTHLFDFGWDTPVDQAIRGQPAVTFRIYGYGAEAGNGTWRFDDVTISAGATPTAVTLSSQGSETSRSLLPLLLLLLAAATYLFLRGRPAFECRRRCRGGIHVRQSPPKSNTGRAGFM